MKASAKYILSALVYIALFYFFGSYTACYREQWQTFYYDWHYITDTYWHIGGPAIMMGDYLTQFFTSPLLANIIMGIVLGLITFVDACNIRRLSGKDFLMPLSMVAPSILCLLTFDNYWNLGGMMGYWLTSIALSIHISISSRNARLAWGICSTIILYLIGGAIALAYAIIVLIIEKKDLKSYPLFALTALAAIVMAIIAVRTGSLGDWSEALSPKLFYDPRQEAPTLAWLPWTLSILIFTMVTFMQGRNFKGSAKTTNIITVSLALGVVVAAFMAFDKNIDKGIEDFKAYSTLSRYKDWDGILARCGGQPSENGLVQNIINEAWAEKNLLGEHLLDNPKTDITSLLIGEISTPYVAAQLSDIYYSMGHISMSQFYAFEANEHIGYMSPRLLMRLVETNILMGEIGVAKKYLNYLRQTLYYKRWAERQLDMLAKGTLGPELFAKHRCLSIDNSLSNGYATLEDVMNIARSNPSHHATAQYLVAMSIFIGSENNYKPMVNELRSIHALPTPLPSHFLRIYNMIR